GFAIYIPGMQTIMGTVSLGWRPWAVIITAGIIEILLIELAKYLIFTHEKQKTS
ncbi:MAG: hypothetical protein UY31_C0021G0014, partial [Candidatus Wolfebacteria bacterium GW2011_GWE1_48_7]